jgi:NhaP-type Na+/H+ or K+/H+ antiporter
MSTDEILLGLGLAIVLAVGSQLVAARLRIPGIVLLLPVGFIAGAITSDIRPDNLFGASFSSLVDLAVGLILFEAGLHLRVREDPLGLRGIVLRLISIGVVVTAVGVMLSAKVIFGLDWGVSALLGAILVVSGPTVVGPLLAFVRPSERVRSVLQWEGTLIDPLGALLGTLAFTGVEHGVLGGRPFQPGELTLSLFVGLGVGVVAAGLLWVLLRELQRTAPGHSVITSLMVVFAALVSADLLREDSGFLAAAVMGAVLANQRRVDISNVLDFDQTVVPLLIGLLFVLISASVTPSAVSSVLAGSLALIAIMVLLIRPLVVALTTWRSQLTWRERAFVAWMAPRGIVAAATASAFGLELSQAGVQDAEKILPIAFLAIFGTVVLYGLTATPVASLLGVAGTGASRVLIVGGHKWACSMAGALKDAGLEVIIWVGRPEEQATAEKLGLDVHIAPVEDIEDREAQLEGVDQALLLDESDHFNALAAYDLRRGLGTNRVYRLAPEVSDSLQGARQGRILFAKGLTFAELTRRFEGGAALVELPSEPGADGQGEVPAPLFVITGDGELNVVTAGERPETAPGDRTISLVER